MIKIENILSGERGGECKFNEETNVLESGFKFRPTLEEPPIRNIIIGTETLIKTAGVQPDVACNKIEAHDN